MSKTPTKEMIEAVAWSASSQPGMPFGMILTDKDIENILTIGLANAPDALQSATDTPAPQTHKVALDWRCSECGCHSYAHVDEKKSDGKFSPGPNVRCLECKKVYPSKSVLSDAASKGTKS